MPFGYYPNSSGCMCIANTFTKIVGQFYFHPPMKASKDTQLRAYHLLCTAKVMTELYEERKDITQKYVHATSRGHEAIQIATALAIEATGLCIPLLPGRCHAAGHGFHSVRFNAAINGQGHRLFFRRKNILFPSFELTVPDYAQKFHIRVQLPACR
jgi:hypothetical protein